MTNFIKNINHFFYLLLSSIIVFYQKIISPVLPARCRYYPTCSEYGKQALAWHGVWSGIWLLLKRLGRCHPLGGHGIDFVPLPLSSYQYQYVDTSWIKVHSIIYSDYTSYAARLNYLMRG
ncbi:MULTISPECIES: membrane protein insertion efficiency factor YidD [unclassified Psychrobacter]|uniref:membrane protein insertion efficiency factor YidD n=1 Tax=unclassified Psychrobacter TaxID=196806 RepID=UPI003FD246BB